MRLFFQLVAWVVWVLVSACQSPMTVQPSSSNTSDKLTFIDVARFDNQLKGSLTATYPEVTVYFYEKVSPNSTPDRLEKWLNAVERSGGRIDVEPPPGEYVAKDPFAVIGLLGSLWNAIKGNLPLNQEKMYEASEGHDAVISLERNPSGAVVISKITFRRKPAH